MAGNRRQRQIQRGMSGRDYPKCADFQRGAENYQHDRRRAGMAAGENGMH